MEKFNRLKSKVIPINIKDIDTDMIIPAKFLTSVSKEGYGENLFYNLKQDPSFPLNLDRYADAQILVADDNFGCGSSREHAVWALLGKGIKVVISKSFADIFYSNASKNGLLLVTLDAEVVDRLLDRAANGDCFLTVDLEKQEVVTKDSTYKFTYDAFRKHCLLNALDDLSYLLSHKKEINNFKKTQQVV